MMSTKAAVAAGGAALLLWRARRRRQAREAARDEACPIEEQRRWWRGELSFAAFDRSTRMPAEADPARTVAVDCWSQAVDSITHHRCSPADAKVRGLRGDASTELVLDAVETDHAVLQGKEFVTCNHFDIDAFCSVAALLMDRAAARRLRDVLVETARIGDFRELAFERLHEPHVDLALKMCCLLNTLERKQFARPFETADGDKWDYFLCEPSVLRLLFEGDAAASEAVWAAEYERVLEGCRTLRDPAVSRVRHFEDVGLVVIETPEPLHYYSLFSVCANADVVLCIYSGGRMEVEQRYTTFVELTSRPVLPRVCLTKLARALRERVPGENWHANRFVDSGPLLRIKDEAHSLTKAERYGHPFERPILPSSIGSEDMVNQVLGFLRAAVRQGGLRAAPSTEWDWARMHELNTQLDWKALAVH